jgi:DNA-binding NtrC family response regulator
VADQEAPRAGLYVLTSIQQSLDDVAAETSQPKRSRSPEAMERLAAAKWPGKLRQLRVVAQEAQGHTNQEAFNGCTQQISS